jgi:peptide/nickel transport system permease protein
MRQRVMIAMGMVKEPRLLIADEPTTALDVTIQAQIMDVLSEVRANHGTAIVLISHNLALVSQNCDRVMVMYAGRIVEELPAAELAMGAGHPYARALVSAVPGLRRSGERTFEAVRGETPDITALPPGCPFHPRCPLAITRCSQEQPVLLAHGARHRVACHRAFETEA